MEGRASETTSSLCLDIPARLRNTSLSCWLNIFSSCFYFLPIFSLSSSLWSAPWCHFSTVRVRPPSGFVTRKLHLPVVGEGLYSWLGTRLEVVILIMSLVILVFILVKRNRNAYRNSIFSHGKKRYSNMA